MNLFILEIPIRKKFVKMFEKSSKKIRKAFMKYGGGNGQNTDLASFYSHLQNNFSLQKLCSAIKYNNTSPIS